MGSGTLYGPTAGSGKHWRAYAKWSDSQTATTFTCNWTTGMQSLSWGINVSHVDADAYINGSGKHVYDQSFYSPTSGTVMKDLVSNSVTINKTKSTQKIAAACTVYNHSGYQDGKSRIDSTWTIPALASYSVKYNANGGSGAPGNQTKWYGETLTLSSTKPTRTGYAFQGWGTSATTTTVSKAPGSTYTTNASITYYAVWKANTWTISYNANGGSGAPGNQTKTYGKTLTLSSTRPTRTNYNFKGWATSSTATSAQYQPGGSFTTNATTTLYAVWQLAYVKPRITNLNADRCNSAGTLSEDGQYAKVTFNWATDKTVSSVKIVCNGTTTTVSGQSGTSGSVTQVVGANALSTENSYTVTVTVTDSGGSSTSTTTLAPMSYIIDFSPQGGVAIGEPAEDSKRFDVHVPTYHHGTTSLNGITNVNSSVVVGPSSAKSIFMNEGSSLWFKDINDEDVMRINRAGGTGQLGIHARQLVLFDGYDGDSTGGGYTDASTGGGTILGASHIYMRQNAAIFGRLTSGSYSAMLRMNTSNQVELNWTSGGLRGRVMKQIWSGTLSTGKITVSELPYYNVFALEAYVNSAYHKMFTGVITSSRNNIAFGVLGGSLGGTEIYALNVEVSGTSFNVTRNTWFDPATGTYPRNAIKIVKIFGVL